MKTKLCSKCKTHKKLDEFSKDKGRRNGLCPWCKKCQWQYRKSNKKRIRNTQTQYRQKYPWRKTFSLIRQRCENLKNNRYKDYGGRGIKCLITSSELKELWFRDKAFEMKKPSIDRKDNDGNYEYSNCGFIELDKNSGKNKQKTISQYDLNNDFIREWESITEASQELKIAICNISSCVSNKRKTAGSFKWKSNKSE